MAEIRLLDEAFDGTDLAVADRFAGKNVTVARLRLGRLDPECHNAAGLGARAAGKAGGSKCLDVQDDVVGGKREHHGLRVAAGGNRGRGCDGGPESRRIGSITTVASTPTSSACRRAKKWKLGPVMTIGGANIGSCTRRRVSW